MSRLSAEHEELLTGLLDGQGSSVELQEAETLLKTSVEAQAFYQQLSLNRDALRGLPSIQAPDFSKRIVSLARERAIDTGAAAPWIRTAQVQLNPSASRSWWQERSAALLFAAAVACVVVGGSLYWSLRSKDGSTTPLVAQGTQPELKQHTETDSIDKIPAEAVPSKESSVVDPQAIASSEPTLSHDNARSVPQEQMDAPKPTDSMAANGESGSSLTDKNSVQPMLPSNLNGKEQSPLAGIDQSPSDYENLGNELGQLLVIVDVTASKEFEAMEVLNDILLRHDIASANELNVGSNVVAALEKSRLVDGIVSEQRRATEADSTSLIFVKARATRLDAAISEVIQDVEAFPEFSFDLAFDAPAMSLYKELRLIQEVELDKLRGNRALDDSMSVASILRHSDSSDSFVGSERRQPSMSVEDRKSFAGLGVAGLSAEEANPVSYVLFVLRTAK